MTLNFLFNDKMIFNNSAASSYVSGIKRLEENEEMEDVEMEHEDTFSVETQTALALQIQSEHTELDINTLNFSEGSS